jgi:hypothetical protein
VPSVHPETLAPSCVAAGCSTEAAETANNVQLQLLAGTMLCSRGSNCLQELALCRHCPTAPAVSDHEFKSWCDHKRLQYRISLDRESTTTRPAAAACLLALVAAGPRAQSRPLAAGPDAPGIAAIASKGAATTADAFLGVTAYVVTRA